MTRARAATCSACRWRSLGTPATKPSSSARTTSGAAASSGSPRALRQHLGEQPQRERMAVGDADEAVAHLLRDPGAREQLARLLRPQVAHRDDAQELAPAGVAPPRLARRLAAGDHDERRRGQPGHEALAQPVLQRGRGLEGVEQEHDPPARGERAGHRRRAGHAECFREGRLESGRRRLVPAQVEPHGREPRGLGGAAERVEQRRLAHAAGAVDEQHAERRLLGLERPPEQLDLRRAADEPAPAGTAQPVRHGARGRGDLDHQPTLAPRRRPRQ